MTHEKHISTCLRDFYQFITFNENEHPILSAKLGVFGKKDSFALNGKLVNQKKVLAPNYTQDQYPVIDLMFELALLGNLYTKGNDEKGKPALIKTSMLDDYLALNDAEKYIFLLQTYWTKYDFIGKFDRLSSIIDFYRFLVRIATSKLQPVYKTNKKRTDSMYSQNADFQNHLRFFGMGELELIDGAKGKYEDSILSFIPNQHGVMMAEFLRTQALAYWKRNDLEFLHSETDHALNDKQMDPFEVFKNVFPNNIVQNTLTKTPQKTENGVYYFKVSLSTSLWRKIKLAGNHTFYQLHLAIQEAFNFSDDHLYAFYVNGNRRTGKPIYCSELYDDYREKDDDPMAETTSLADMGLFAKQNLFYLFDFGDMWEFQVRLIKIEKDEPLPIKPQIIERKGQSPEQYGNEW